MSRVKVGEWAGEFALRLPVASEEQNHVASLLMVNVVLPCGGCLAGVGLAIPMKLCARAQEVALHRALREEFRGFLESDEVEVELALIDWDDASASWS